MRSYLSPIGYDSTRVTRPVISYGLDTDDSIILLRPELEMDDNRASQAIRDVRQMIMQIEPDVSIRIEEVPHDDFQGAVAAICDIFENTNGEVIVNLSGGARDIFLALCVSSMVHLDRISTIVSFSDIDGDVREISLPDLTVDAPSASFETLVTIAKLGRPVSISELTEERDIAKSTVTRHLQQLESRGLVDTWQEGKSKFAQITFSGILLVRSNGQ